MKGENDLVLNEATMIAAIQHWLNDDQFAFKRGVKVTGVRFEKDGCVNTFVVTFAPLETAIS